MTTETSRVAQIIADAADKTLGIRPDGQPKPQDIAAAEAIAAEYVLIRRDELPKTNYVERDGSPFIDVEGADSVWSPKGNIEQTRRWGLEYIAAAEAMERWRAEQETLKRDKRRDELALQFGYSMPYLREVSPLSKAIDRIIELEDAA